MSCDAKSNAWRTAFLKLVFQNIAATGIGDAGGLLPSAAPGNLYVALHTADPGAAGNQTTSECAYTGYAREAVVRDVAGWTVAANAVENAAEIAFGLCTAVPQTALWYSIGMDAAGAGVILFRGELTAPGLNIQVGVTPTFAAGAIQGTET